MSDLNLGKRGERAILDREDRIWKFTVVGNFGLVLFTKPGLGLVSGFGLLSKQHTNRRERGDKAREVVRGSSPGSGGWTASCRSGVPNPWAEDQYWSEAC